ncbi:hypothetical protein J4208_03555 [Candidatus Woesearchaeota archaeon]|nr:hypothetical protein [Candidatus Woesearchaeota archaeon]
MVDIKKTQLSVFIGFLFLVLLSMLFYLFRSANDGGIIARWVLFIVFGAVALILASFAIGYIFMLLTNQQEQPRLQSGSEVHYRRTAQQPQKGIWVDLAQLHATQNQQQKAPKKKTSRRSSKKKRR